MLFHWSPAIKTPLKRKISSALENQAFSRTVSGTFPHLLVSTESWDKAGVRTKLKVHWLQTSDCKIPVYTSSSASLSLSWWFFRLIGYSTIATYIFLFRNKLLSLVRPQSSKGPGKYSLSGYIQVSVTSPRQNLWRNLYVSALYFLSGCKEFQVHASGEVFARKTAYSGICDSELQQGECFKCDSMGPSGVGHTQIWNEI